MTGCTGKVLPPISPCPVSSLSHSYHAADYSVISCFRRRLSRCENQSLGNIGSLPV